MTKLSAFNSKINMRPVEEGGEGFLIAISLETGSGGRFGDEPILASKRLSLFPFRVSSFLHRQESCSLGEVQGVISRDNV